MWDALTMQVRAVRDRVALAWTLIALSLIFAGFLLGLTAIVLNYLT